MKYIETDDLTHLADLLISSEEILEDNDFPLRKYKKWKQNQA